MPKTTIATIPDPAASERAAAARRLDEDRALAAAVAENRRGRGKVGRVTLSRLERLRARFDAFSRDELRRAARTRELPLVALSFDLWMLEERCGWRERAIGAERFRAVWGWWLALHYLQRVELAWNRADRFRRAGRRGHPP